MANVYKHGINNSYLALNDYDGCNEGIWAVIYGKTSPTGTACSKHNLKF